MKLSAYIPVYNNRATLEAVLQSVLQQSAGLDDVYVVDDASTDGSPELAARMGVRVVRQAQNTGRGAVRARAMLEARNPLVLCCDATNVLETDFAQKATTWLEEKQVAGVFGRLTQTGARTVAERWRGRHLFKVGEQFAVRHQSSLITFGTLLRRDAVLAVGNYNTSYRCNEDVELGERLLAAGYDVVFDPNLLLYSITGNSIRQVLERYSRWYGPKPTELTFSGYLRLMSYSLKSMAARDLSERDLLSVPISLVCPHVQYARSFFESIRLRRQH